LIDEIYGSGKRGFKPQKAGLKNNELTFFTLSAYSLGLNKGEGVILTNLIYDERDKDNE